MVGSTRGYRWNDDNHGGGSGSSTFNSTKLNPIKISMAVTSSDTAVISLKGLLGFIDNAGGDENQDRHHHHHGKGHESHHGKGLGHQDHKIDTIKETINVAELNSTEGLIISKLLSKFSNAEDVLISRSVADLTHATIHLANGNNLIFGGDGNDIFYGNTHIGSTALLFGGAGNNTLHVNSEGGRFYLEQGNDHVFYDATAALKVLDYIDAGIGKDILHLNITSAAASLPWVQSAIAAYQALLGSSNINNDAGPTFTFSSFDPSNINGVTPSGLLELTVRNFEGFSVTVDNQVQHPVLMIESSLDTFTATISNGVITDTSGPVHVVAPGSAKIIDINSPGLVSLIATLLNGDGGAAPDGAAETLSAITTGTNITATYDAGVLSLTGYDTLAHYAHVVESIMYNNTDQDPANGARLIHFVADDGAFLSNVAITELEVNITHSLENSITALTAADIVHT